MDEIAVEAVYAEAKGLIGLTVTEIDVDALAERVVRALTTLGRLVPPGGEMHYEWGQRSHWRDGTDHDIPHPSELMARQRAAEPPVDPKMTRARSLIRRVKYTGPWELVDDA